MAVFMPGFPASTSPFEWTFDGPEQTDTQFQTHVIIRQYDGVADFPLYPLNPVATLNALLGIVYVQPFLFDVSLAPDPTATPATVSQHGNTTYYFFETEDLPLFGPLRTLGVPESLIDVVEPFFRVLVELGYDRTIPPGEPTPARLIPPLDPAKVITDLVNAIGEGVKNALALVGLPPLLSIPAPATLAAPATETATTERFPQVTSSSTLTQTQQVTSTGAAFGTRQLSTDTATSTTVIATARADAFPRVAPSEVVTETDPPTSAQTATDTEQSTPPKNITETTTATSMAASAVVPSARPTPEASATSALTSKPAKPAGQPAKPWPVVRDSLGVDQQLPGRSHRGGGHQPTTQTAAAGAGEATGARSSAPSSSAASSSTGSSSGGGASGGDGDSS